MSKACQRLRALLPARPTKSALQAPVFSCPKGDERERPLGQPAPSATQVQDPVDQQLLERIEAARWHISRYDSLRGSVASRASFVITANAALIAGVALLAPQTIKEQVFGGRPSLVLIAIGAAVTLALATSSIASAAGAFVALKTWRKLYGDEPPRSLYYQHTDTIREFPQYTPFRENFELATRSQELTWATVNLWVILQTHAYRYRFLRRSIRMLRYGVTSFTVSVVVALILVAMGR